MKYEIEVREYTPETGVEEVWEPSAFISTRFFIGGDEVPTKNCALVISANRAGFITLARVLLQLAQNQVPEGAHIHYDDLTGLEDDSCETIFQRVNPE